MHLKQSVLRVLRLAAIVLAAAALILGICRGETGEIFNKASHICLECIGIG